MQRRCEKRDSGRKESGNENENERKITWKERFVSPFLD